MLAVAGEDVVVGLPREDAADDRSLLADVEVAVAADLGLRVLLLRPLLEAADELHHAVDPEQEIAVLLLKLELLGCDRFGDRCGRWLDRCDHLLLTIVQRRSGRGGGGVRCRVGCSSLNTSVRTVTRPSSR